VHNRCAPIAWIGTDEVTLLLEHHLEFIFQGHAPKQPIHSLAACNAVTIAVVTAIGRGQQVLHTGIGLGQRPLTEETQITLNEEQSF